MKQIRRGFTLIEVAIFLVITGALFVAVTIGVQNSIYQQRQNDAVQNLAEFVRSIYSQTMNVESEGSGNSDNAIYGKLLTLGEAYNLAGELNDKNALFSYNVVGKIGDTSSGNILEALGALGINVISQDEESGRYHTLGLSESYVPKWASAIQNAENYDRFKGAILIIRHPRSGTVYTYVMEGETVEVNKTVREANLGPEIVAGKNPLLPFIEGGNFSIKEVNLCLNMEGNEAFGNRYDIRIIKNARNASGVETILGEDNICRMEE